MAFSPTDEWLESHVSDDSTLSCFKAISDLVSSSQVFGIELDTNRAAGVVRQLQLMLEKNKVVNLTSITEPHDALVLHSLDSLLFLPIIEEVTDISPDLEILDMGTGGGFPGIPLACCLDARVTLLDSVGKKVKACQEFVDALELSNRVICVHNRLEDYARDTRNRNRYDVIAARAVASLDVLIEYATPLLAKGGCLVLSKGFPSEEEFDHANKASQICGLKRVFHEQAELPDDFGHREFFVYKKFAPSRVKLPRKTGEARKNPLYLR